MSDMDSMDALHYLNIVVTTNMIILIYAYHGNMDVIKISYVWKDIKLMILESKVLIM